MLLASHLLAEVETVCHRVIGVADGRVALDYRTVSEGQRRLIELEVAQPDDVAMVSTVADVVVQARVADRVLHLAADLPTAEVVGWWRLV